MSGAFADEDEDMDTDYFFDCNFIRGTLHDMAQEAHKRLHELARRVEKYDSNLRSRLILTREVEALRRTIEPLRLEVEGIGARKDVQIRFMHEALERMQTHNAVLLEEIRLLKEAKEKE